MPPLSEEEESDLRRDIQREGVQYPVKILRNGVIVDGYNRWKLSGGKAPVEVLNLDEEAALGLGLRLNLKRRHISLEQRNELIRELRRLGKTQEQVAQLINCSRSLIDHVEDVNQIRDARTVNAKDPPDLRLKIPEEHHQVIWKRAKKQKEPLSRIAADYKVTDGRISQILNHYEKTLDRERAIEDLKDRASRLPPPRAEFSTIVVDPPWPTGSGYDPENWRGASPYPEMRLEEIKALKIPSAPDCVLWLWTINSQLHEAFHVLEVWSFEPKTVLTWVKPSIGLGRYLRGQTEHCVLAVKGNPKLKLTNQATILQAPRRQHSRKPDEFYKLVDEICEWPKLDYFGRESREGWIVYGTNQLHTNDQKREKT